MSELTRKELIEKICLTDATYDCNQGNCSSSCDKCEDVLNYFLDRYDAKVRSEVINEIIEEMDYLNHQGGGLDDLLLYLNKIKEQSNG